MANVFGFVGICASATISSKNVLSLNAELLPVVANKSGEHSASDLRRLGAKTGVAKVALLRFRFLTRANISSESGDSTQSRAKVVEFGSESFIKSTFWRTTSRLRSLKK